jgi:CO/xanthine dehydrogenase Mo-binding subunit
VAAGAALSPGPLVGRPLARREDERVLRGRARYVDDIELDGMAHAAFVRSPHAHALVGGIDADAARSAPGVQALFTAADLGHPSLLAMLERDEFVPTPMPILAGDRVRFVGEPVAIVVADDDYRAEDAAELAEVDWDPQPAAASIEAATAAGAPRGSRGSSPRRRLASARPSPARGSPPCPSRDVPAWPNGTTAMTSWSCTSPPRCRTRSVPVSPRR